MLKIKNNDYAFLKVQNVGFGKQKKTYIVFKPLLKKGYWVLDLKDMKIAKQMSFYQIKFS